MLFWSSIATVLMRTTADLVMVTDIIGPALAIMQGRRADGTAITPVPATGSAAAALPSARPGSAPDFRPFATTRGPWIKIRGLSFKKWEA